MKKLLIFVWSILFSLNGYAHEFNYQKNYSETTNTISDVPNVIEFFSFFCPYCYEIEKKHQISALIKKNFKKDKNIQIYHVNYLNDTLGKTLTKSWIIAQELKIEEKVILPIFEGIQKTHTIHNVEDIKKIFYQTAKINQNVFDTFWSSFSLEILFNTQNENIKKCNLHYIPSMLINGKYLINYSAIENNFKNHFSKKYINLIKKLINKK